MSDKKSPHPINLTESGRIKKKNKDNLIVTKSGRITALDGPSTSNPIEISESGRVIQKTDNRNNLEMTESGRIVQEDPDSSKNKLKITNSGRIVPKDSTDKTVEQYGLEITDSLRIVPADRNRKRHKLKISNSGRIMAKFVKGTDIKVIVPPKSKIVRKKYEKKKKDDRGIEISDSGKLISKSTNKNKHKLEITNSGRIIPGKGKIKNTNKKLEITDSGRVIQDEMMKKETKLEVTESFRIVPQDRDETKHKLKITDSGRIVAKDSKDTNVDKRRLEVSDSLRIVPANQNKQKNQLRITTSGRIVPKFVKEKEVEITPSGKIIKKGGKQDIEGLSQTSNETGMSKSPGWITTAMAKNFDRNKLIKVTIRDSLIHLVLLILATIGALGSRDSKMFYLTDALRNQFFESRFLTSHGEGIKFYDIRSVTDMWSYAESVMVESFYAEHYYDSINPISETAPDDKKILYQNKLLGVPRIRQVRVRPDSCVIHDYFQGMFTKCYSGYSSSSKDISPFGLRRETAWIYSDSDKTQSYTYTGKVGTYPGGGYYKDLSVIKNESTVILYTLKSKLWITRASRAVFIDFSIYNANYNYFTICKIIFELPPTGGIIPSHRFRTARLLQFVTAWDHLVFICTVASCLFILFVIFEKVREIAYFKKKFFLIPWSIIDLIIIILTFIMIFDIIGINAYLEDTIKPLNDDPYQYINLEYFDVAQTRLYNVSALRLFLIYVKLFNYMNVSKTMSQLNNTISRCALDVLGFGVMFFVIFTAFALLGYLLFGAQVEDFRSFGESMFTLLRTILGEFDYKAIEAANRILAPIFFLTYIFLVFFVLLNMFLAIINDTYTDVKTEIAISPEQKHLSDAIRTFFKKDKDECGTPKMDKNEFIVTLGQIREALLKCGFKDVEIEMFYQRFNIDPFARGADYDLNMLVKQMGQPAASAILPPEELDSDKFVKVDDLLVQEEKLVQIEITVTHLITKVETLIEQLNSMDSVKKVNLFDQSLDTISESEDIGSEV